MKVQCPKCSTSYRLPQGKLPAGGGGFKVRCKNCGHVIDVASREPSKPGAIAGGEVAWFIAVGSDRQGPFVADEIISRLKAGVATTESFVWRKGFKGWVKLAEVEEFRDHLGPLAAVGDEATQLMNLSEMTGSDEGNLLAPQQSVKEISSMEPVPAQDEDSSAEAMVWQRRETSVLFSLDDYKVRKRTQQTPAVASSDGSIQMKPIEDAPAAPVSQEPKAAPKVGVIALDESEIKHVAEVLSKRRGQRRMALASAAVLTVLVVLAVATWLLVGKMMEEPRVAPTTVAEAPRSAVPVPAPQPAPVPVPEPAPAPAAEPASEKGGEAAEPAAEAAVEEEKRAAAPQSARKASAPREVREPARPARVAEPAPKPEPKPAAKPAATDDANALLAQFRQGQASGTQEAKSTGDRATAGGDDSSLPDQLSNAAIASTLRRKQGAVDTCVRNSGAPTPFRTNTRIVIQGSGSVSSVSAGDAGVAASCIENALRSVKFPRFKGADMTVPYVFTVR
jgi:predicted Zn finger-like uncharacterized protein